MNWMIIISITSAIAAIVVALATWFYTIYTKKMFNEFKRQMDFMVRNEEEKYILERRPFFRRLLFEIAHNEWELKSLLKEVEPEINNPSRVEIIKFSDNIYTIFVRSKYDLKNGDIIYNLDCLYMDLEMINQYKSNIDKLDREEIQEIRSAIVELIGKCLTAIDKLYTEFDKEIGYNHKKSKFYIFMKSLENEDHKEQININRKKYPRFKDIPGP